MPYYTKVNRRGKSKTTYSKLKPSAYNTARKALREVNKLKAASGPHLKDIENTNAFGLGTAPTVQDTSAITFIAAGGGDSQRTGDYINVRSILIDGTLASDNNNGRAMMHIAVVVDKQQEADTNPSYSDVFETRSSGALNGNLGLYQIRRQENALGRFRVLWSKVIRVSDSSHPVSYFKKYIKFKGTHKVEYNESASGDIQKNGIYVVARCDGDTVPSADSVPMCNWTTRIRFDP